MNYPRYVQKRTYDKKEREKDIESMYQRKQVELKPVVLRGSLDEEPRADQRGGNPGAFEYLIKQSSKVPTTATLDYKRKMIDTVNKVQIEDEDLCNVQPVSNTISKNKQSDAAQDYRDIIWNFQEVMHKKLKVEYKNESCRHYAVG